MSSENAIMEIDTSFNWQLADRIESSGPEPDTLMQDQDDYEITQRRPILQLVDVPSPEAR
jgi:hypothetical protein